MANGETLPLFHFNEISVIINHDLSPSSIDCTPSASQPRTYTWVRRMLILRSTIVGQLPTTWKWPFVVQSLVTFSVDFDYIDHAFSRLI